MLDFNVFTEGMTKLGDAFDKDVKQNTINVYYESLKEMTNERFKHAVEQIIKEDIYFPKIRDFFIVKEMPSQADFWEDHSLYWYWDNKVLKARVVPKAEGNKKPKITYNYEEMPEEERIENKKRAREIINSLAETKSV